MTLHSMRSGFTVAAAALLMAPAAAFAHASVFPKVSEAGAYEKYVLRVPNERDVATTRIELHFPRSLRVVSFADVPGWAIEILSDSAKHIVGAVWTGSLAPRRFVEFPFVAVNPKTPVKLVWPSFQTYSTGERVDWIGREDAKQPASVTNIADASARNPGVTLALWVCLIALALSVGGLIIALRPDVSSGGFQPGS